MAGWIVRNKFPKPVDPNAARANWAERGYSCHLFTDLPDRHWDGFVYATDELVTAVEGHLEVAVGVTSHIAKAEDEVFIPGEALHSVHNIHSG